MSTDTTQLLALLAPAAEALAIALLLSGVNKALVDYLLAPVRKKWPELDLWWAVYVSLVTGALISFVADVNLFSAWIEVEILGKILTALMVGGGASLIYDIFIKPRQASNG